MREFDTGATRDTDTSKLDLEGFLSPRVLQRYAEYMNKHRVQADGKLRDSDNWQKGIPLDAYMKSGYRHFFDWWVNHRGVTSVAKDNVEESLCALIFNAMGYLHEHLKNQECEDTVIPEPQFSPGDVVFITLREDSEDFCDLKKILDKYQQIGTVLGLSDYFIGMYAVNIGTSRFCLYADEMQIIKKGV